MNTIAEIIWNVSPIITDKLGPFTLKYYGILFACGFFICFLVLNWIYKREKKNEKELEWLILYLILGAVIGARLGHCLFYDPIGYLADPIQILFIWKGGLASHGAGIGIILALILFKYRHRSSDLIWIFDRVSIVVPIAACFVRIGNFFNHEIYGFETNLPWGVKFLYSDIKLHRDQIRHPTQIYEAIAYIIIFVIMFLLYRSKGNTIKKGLLTGVFLILLFTARFFIEFLKERQELWENSLPIDMGQLLSIPFIILGVGFIIWSFKNKEKQAQMKK
jgi:prolipoprotein diacylglyceryl transferase